MARYEVHEMHKGMGKGEKVLYPKMPIYSQFDYDKVVELIHDYSPSFSKGAIRGVLDGLITAMRSALPMGHTMKIDGLGVFSPSLEFCDKKEQGQAADQTDGRKPKDDYNHVRVKSINLKVDKELLDQINRENTFVKVDSKVHRCKALSTTIEERQQRALQMIRQRGFITLTDYANANGMSNPAASRELKRIVSDPASGITTKGSAPHKVWVERKLT